MPYRANRAISSGILLLLFIFIAASLVTGCSAGNGPTADQHFANAKKYYQDKYYDKAVIELKNALKKWREQGQPKANTSDARWLLASIYLETGDGVGAELELRRVADTGVPKDAITVPMFRALLLQGAYQKLLEQDTESLSKDDLALALALRGQAYLRLKKVEAAAKELAKALEISPDLPEVTVGLAELEAMRRQPGAAMELVEKLLAQRPDFAAGWTLKGDLERLSNQWTESSQSYSKAIKLNPNVPLDHFKRALVLIEAGQIEESQADIDWLIRLSNSYPGLQYLLGRIDFAAENYTQSLTKFQNELQISPKHADSHLYAGLSHLFLNQLEQAEEEFRITMALSDRQNIVRELLAEAYSKKKDYARAKTVLEPLMQGGRTSLRAAMMMANIRAELGEVSRDANLLKELTDMRPGDPELLRQLGLALLSEGKSEQGFATLQQSISINPNLDDAKYSLINFYLNADQEKQALAAAKDLIRQYPEDDVAHLLLGVVQLSLKNNAEAEKSFQKALQFDPKNRDASMGIALIRENEGRSEEAASIYGKLLEADPKMPGPYQGLARLANARGDVEATLGWLEKAYVQKTDSKQLDIELTWRYLQLDRNQDALRVAEELYRTFPSEPESLYLLAAAQLRNNSDDSLDTAQRFTVLAPNSADGWTLLANAQIREMRMDDASRSLQRALRLDGNNLGALAVTAQLNREARLYPKALEVARKLQKIRPQLAFGYRLEGDILTEQGEHAKAVAPYKIAYKYSPDWSTLESLTKARAHSGDAAGALASLRDWVDSHPEDRSARVRLAQFLERNQNIPEAFLEYQRIADEVWALDNPSPAQISAVESMLQQAYIRQHQIDRAIERIRGRMAKYGRKVELLHLLGTAQLANDDSTAARASFQELLKLQPNFVPAKLNLAQIEVSIGNKDKAESLLRQVLVQSPNHRQASLKLAELLDYSPEGLNLLEQAQLHNPKSLDTGVILVREYLSNNRITDAIRLAEDLRKSAGRSNRTRILPLLGQAYFVAGNVDSAISTYEQWTRAEPRNADAWYRLALVRGGKQDTKGAADALEKALEVDPNHFPSLVASAKLAQKSKNHIKAQGIVRRLRENYADNPIVSQLEGDVLLQKQDYPGAVRAYQTSYEKEASQRGAIRLYKAALLAGDDQIALNALNDWLQHQPEDNLVRFQVALFLQERGRDNEAATSYEKLLASDGFNGVLLNNLAIVYQRLGDPRAEEIARKAYSVAPGNPTIQDTLGWLLVSKHQLSEGLTLLEQALAQQPENGSMAYHAAVALNRLDRQPEAVELLKKTLASKKPFPETVAAKTLLSELKSE